MTDKKAAKNRISALAFAIHELELFLDTHPENRQAMQLRGEFMMRKKEAIADYESRFGKYVVTTADVEPTDYWDWLDSPWPWEKED